MYVGIDAHERDCHATVMNDEGEVVSTARFPTNLGTQTAWAARLPKGAKLAFEASTVGQTPSGPNTHSPVGTHR